MCGNVVTSNLLKLKLSFWLTKLKSYSEKIKEIWQNKSDEEKLGFSYSSLDRYIRTGEKDASFDKIDKMHKASSHKKKIESFMVTHTSVIMKRMY